MNPEEVKTNILFFIIGIAVGLFLGLLIAFT